MYCKNDLYPIWCETKRQWCYPRSETPDDPKQFCTFKKDSEIRRFMEAERIVNAKKDAYKRYTGKVPIKQRSLWKPPLPPMFATSSRAVPIPFEQIRLDVDMKRTEQPKITRLTKIKKETAIETRTVLFNVKSDDPLILQLEKGDEITIYPFSATDETVLLNNIGALQDCAPEETAFEMLWIKGQTSNGTVGLVNAKNAYIESRIAMFAYDAASEDELSFKGGDYLYIQDKSKGDWWLACTVKRPNVSGYVPSNYLAICVSSPETTSNYKKNSHIYIQSIADGQLQGTNEAGDTFIIDESLLLYPRCEEDEDEDDEEDDKAKEVKKEAEKQVQIMDARKRRKQITTTWKREMKPAGSINELVFGLPGM